MSPGDLDPVLVPPRRLACMGAASVAGEVEFTFLRDRLGVSESDLSKHLSVLVDSGYLRSRKTGRGASRTTWISITPEGREALDAHVAVLHGLIAPADMSEGGAPPLSESASSER